MRKERTEGTERTEGGRTMRQERQEARELVQERFNTSSVRLLGRLIAEAIAKTGRKVARKVYGNEYEELAVQVIEEMLEKVSEAAYEQLAEISKDYDKAIENFLVEKYLENGNPSQYAVEMWVKDTAITSAMYDAFRKANDEFWNTFNVKRWSYNHGRDYEERLALEGMLFAVFDSLNKELLNAIGDMEDQLAQARRDVGFYVKEEAGQ